MSEAEVAGPVTRPHVALRVAGAVVGIVVLSDWLFWGAEIGVSAAAGLAALMVCVLIANPFQARPADLAKALLLVPLTLAPLVEDVSLLSLAVGLVGTAAFALLARA